jgi:hypothetical protein
MTAPKRRERQLDPFVRETTRLRARGRDTCDCPCHWWPDVEHSPCCAMAGMRYIAGEDAYVPWPEQDQP